MADTGWLYPGGTTQYTIGATTTWSNPGYVAADDTSYATAALPNQVAGSAGEYVSSWLIAQYFYPNVPSGYEVDGMVAEILFKSNLPYNPSTGGSGASSVVTFFGSDSLDGTTSEYYSSGNQQPSTAGAFEALTWGGSTDKWSGFGTTLTRAKVNASSFTLKVRALNGSNEGAADTVELDYIRAKFFYSLAPKQTDVYVKDSSTWKTVDPLTVKDTGSWKEPNTVHVKDSGSWKKVYGT